MIYDVVIIGAGISGLSAAARCTQCRLQTLVLEKSRSMGGLWRDLPDWQDIQLPMEDWAIAGTKIEGVMRDHILANIISFSERYQLKPYILFNQTVCGLSRGSDQWMVTTKEGGTFESRFVIVASGPHQRKFVPEIKRSNVTLKEFHTSEITDPLMLKDKSVVVYGGGASSFDLIELALQHSAKEIHWVYRNIHWMIPSSKPKHARSYIRRLAKIQMLGADTDKQNRQTTNWLREKYKYFGISELMPKVDFDFRIHQLIPGRPMLIKNISRINRYHDAIIGLSGRTVLLNEINLEADMLVYATGYKLDLKYLGLTDLQDITTTKELRKRCGGFCMSLDYPNLFILGISSAEMTGTTMWAQSIFAKSIVSHIKGQIKFSSKPIMQNINHWDLLKLLASFDRKNYIPIFWRLKYILLSQWYAKFPRKLVRV